MIRICSNIGANTTNIATNTTNVGTNTTNIATNTTNIGTNTTNIATNSTDITALQTTTGGLRTDIDRNAGRIEENTQGVAMAMAMAGALPYLTDTETFALSGSFGTFDNGNALAFGGRLRLSKRLTVAGGLAMGLDGGNYGGTVSARIGW